MDLFQVSGAPQQGLTAPQHLLGTIMSLCWGFPRLRQHVAPEAQARSLWLSRSHGRVTAAEPAPCPGSPTAAVQRLPQPPQPTEPSAQGLDVWADLDRCDHGMGFPLCSTYSNS